jgi:hypothetical protein
MKYFFKSYNILGDTLLFDFTESRVHEYCTADLHFMRQKAVKFNMGGSPRCVKSTEACNNLYVK